MSNNQLYEVFYQGVPGAYSQQAIFSLANRLGMSVSPKSSRNFSELFENIKKSGLGIVPIENSTAGSVVECVDLLLSNDVEIVAEIMFEIDHCLLGKKGTSFENIQEVHSHPQALMQCHTFIENHNLVAVSATDTAKSAEYVSQEETNGSVGAISSKLAAEIYGLEVLKSSIQSIKENTTRFFLVKQKDTNFEFEKKLSQPNKTSLSFETKNIPGALYKCLGALATHNLNLSKIESRPNHKKKFSYRFFVDVENALEDENAQSALEEISYFSHNLKVLGRYRKDS